MRIGTDKEKESQEPFHRKGSWTSKRFYYFMGTQSRHPDRMRAIAGTSL